MTISSTPAVVQYQGDGVTVTFTVPYFFQNNTDLVLTKRSSAGVDAVLVIGTDYSVSGAGNTNGGSVTLNVAPKTGTPNETLTIVSDPIIQQQTHYLLNGLFPSSDTENAIDLLTRIAQVIRRREDRSIRAPDADVNPVMLLPAAALRGANQGTFPHFAAGGGDLELVTTLPAGGPALSSSLIATTLNSLKQTAAEVAAGVTPTDYAYVPGNVKRYGAVGDGVADDTTALLNAIASNVITNLPTGKYLVSSTIAVPAGKALFGAGLFSPKADGVGVGSAIIGALALTPVVSLGSQTLVGASAKGFSIFRAAGVPGAGTEALFINGGQGPIFEDIYVNGHGIGYHFFGLHVGVGNGITHFGTRLFSGGIYDAHVVVDTVTEVRLSHCRFGSNGVGDQTCTAYLRITGGNAGQPASGPNTVYVDHTQFNQGGGNHPAYWLQFNNLTAPGLPTFDAREFTFEQCHIEGVGTALVNVDATWSSIDRLCIEDCGFNTPLIPFFALPASGCTLNDWRIANNWIAASTFAPGVDNINCLNVVGNSFSATAVTYTAGAVSCTVNSVGNNYGAGSSCTLAGTNWNQGIFLDTYRPGSTFTNNVAASALANITVMNPGQSLVNWTPTLNFAGAAVGITYTTQSGALYVSGNQVTYEWRIVLSSKGSSVGAARIAGFPINHNNGAFQSGAGGICFGNNNMAGLTAPILAQGPISGAPGYIQLVTQGAAGVVALTDANFTNTADFGGSVTFFL